MAPVGLGTGQVPRRMGAQAPAGLGPGPQDPLRPAGHSGGMGERFGGAVWRLEAVLPEARHLQGRVAIRMGADSSSHFSHLPTEQTRVDQIGVLITCFQFMISANVILVHLRGELSYL